MSCESGLAILGNSLHCVLQNLEVSDSYARQAQAHAGFFRPEGPLLDCQDMFQFLQPSVLVVNFRSAVVNCTRLSLWIWALGTKSRLHVKNSQYSLICEPILSASCYLGAARGWKAKEEAWRWWLLVPQSATAIGEKGWSNTKYISYKTFVSYLWYCVIS